MIDQTKKNQRGYSLIEMAIVIAIVGSLVGASVSIFGNYIISQKTQKTEENIANLSTALGAFRSVYGRYPCPSPLTATKGDLEYGHENENCKTEDYGTSGSCTDGICSAKSSNAEAMPIIIGTLPFKAMGLEETAIYDSYGNKLTYAVTAPLTSRSTFDMTKGGIGVLDKGGVSVVTPENSAHFVIVSHGKNGIGGYTMGGQENGSCVSAAAEEENCDDDQNFMFGSSEAEFDDRVVYFTPVGMSYWQKETTTSNDIFLRDADSIAIGVAATEDLAAVGSTGIKKTTSDNGIVWAQNSSFLSGFLCEYDVTNPSKDCFKSSLIGGKIAEGEGLDCGEKFMVGLKNGKPECEKEIYVSCPDGSFIAGIDEEGKLICDSLAAPHCKTEQIKSSCGKEEKVSYALEGEYRTTLSGTCYMFKDKENLSSDDWSEYFSQGEGISVITNAVLEDDIQKMNSLDREVVDCNTLKGFDGTEGIVRDTYVCEKSEWKHEVAHEKSDYFSSFPLDVTATSGIHTAEVSGASYSNGEDPNHKADDHDCWCREDWKVEYETCGEKLNPTANIRHIYKHKCPSTKASWEKIYSDNSQCQSCVPGETVVAVEELACSDYAGISQDDPLWHGLEGTVTVTWSTICPNGEKFKAIAGVPVYGSTAGCHCPEKPPAMDITYCPLGTTNDYTLPGEKAPRKGIQSLKIDQWICPAVSGDGSMPAPGYWQYDYSPNDVPPCVCDPDLFEYEYKACGGKSQGKKYKKKWDCNTKAWQEEKDWELISDDCNSCSWAPGNENTEAVLFSPKVGSPCACGDVSTPHCNDDEGGMFENCKCKVDNTWIKK